MFCEMTLEEAIEARHSVRAYKEQPLAERAYKEQPLAENVVKVLEEKIAVLNREDRYEKQSPSSKSQEGFFHDWLYKDGLGHRQIPL